VSPLSRAARSRSLSTTQQQKKRQHATNGVTHMQGARMYMHVHATRQHSTAQHSTAQHSTRGPLPACLPACLPATHGYGSCMTHELEERVDAVLDVLPPVRAGEVVARHQNLVVGRWSLVV
jgi:hypothetical protein